MKTNRKAVKQYLLGLIDLEGYTTDDGREFVPQTDNDKILCAYNIALAEVGYVAQEKGKNRQDMIEYWFSGLCSVVSLPYLCGDILKTARQFTKFTEAEENKICQNWFRYMAAQFMQMVNKANQDANK